MSWFVGNNSIKLEIMECMTLLRVGTSCGRDARSFPDSIGLYVYTMIGILVRNYLILPCVRRSYAVVSVGINTNTIAIGTPAIED